MWLHPTVPATRSEREVAEVEALRFESPVVGVL
jgi:hypothetical protein